MAEAKKKPPTKGDLRIRKTEFINGRELYTVEEYLSEGRMWASQLDFSSEKDAKDWCAQRKADIAGSQVKTISFIEP